MPPSVRSAQHKASAISPRALIALQSSAGNLAVSRLVATRQTIQRDGPPATTGTAPPGNAPNPGTAPGGSGTGPAADPAAEAARVGALDADYASAVIAGNWRQVALDLNAYNDQDLANKVALLLHDQLVQVDAAARKAMAGWPPRVITAITAFDAEADRVGQLAFNYQSALDAHNYDQAIIHLNGFNDTDIIARTGQLTPADKTAMLAASQHTSVGGGRMARLIQSVVGNAVTTSTPEQVGGSNYVVSGGYTWRMTPDALVVDVGMQFTPDSGVAVPTDTWFGFIRNIWNHFSAVNQANPSEKKRIDFNPMAGAGHSIQVSAGDGRANAAHYYAGDTRAPQSIPHEFGHLIGLPDEYERDAADYQAATGGAPPAGSGQTDLAQTVARGIHDGLNTAAPSGGNDAARVTAAQAAVQAVLTANHIVAGYSNATPLSHEVAKQYVDIYHNEMSADFMARITGGTDAINNWRETVLGTFQYTSTSIMGDMTDHTHPVEARHVRTFAGYVQQAFARDAWLPQQDH